MQTQCFEFMGQRALPAPPHLNLMSSLIYHQNIGWEFFRSWQRERNWVLRLANGAWNRCGALGFLVNRRCKSVKEAKVVTLVLLYKQAKVCVAFSEYIAKFPAKWDVSVSSHTTFDITAYGWVIICGSVKRFRPPIEFMLEQCKSLT